ncbi:MAG: aminoglycoside phosphotransferase family protein [Ruegeria sp.]
MADVLSEFLITWQLVAVEQVTESPHAQVWKVQTAGGEVAALKLYNRDDLGNEGPGIQLLQDWRDRGAVEILAAARSAILMEWLSGPSLGDIARGGEPERAMKLLAETAARLHLEPNGETAGLTPLDEVFEAFFDCKFAPECPSGLKKDITRGREMARELLASPPSTVPLHGDLHFDNVIADGGKLKVIDAKGYVGDPAFELANALRNPKELTDLLRQPDHIRNCLTVYAQAMKVDRSRQARWAAAKCALSIFWRSGGAIDVDAEADLLNLLLHAADQ